MITIIYEHIKNKCENITIKTNNDGNVINDICEFNDFIADYFFDNIEIFCYNDKFKGQKIYSISYDNEIEKITIIK